MNTLSLNRLTKIAIILYSILLAVSFNIGNPSSIPDNVTHYLNSLYPIAQNHFLESVNIWFGNTMPVAFLIGAISVFFKKLFPVGKWLILIVFILNEIGSLIEPAYITYGASQFITEIYTLLEGAILVLLFIPREKNSQIEAQNKAITKIEMDNKYVGSFGIKTILVQASEIMKIKGSQSAIWWAFLAAMVIKLILHLALFSGLAVEVHDGEGLLLLMISFFLGSILITPFIMAGMLIGTKLCRGEIISDTSIFYYFNNWKQLTITNIIICSPLAIIMFLLFKFFQGSMVVLPTLFLYYIFITLSNFTLLLIADKNISIRSAFIESFKKIRLHLLTMILFLLSIALIFVISGLSISLVYKLSSSLGSILAILISAWMVPYVFILFGVMYYRLFDKK